MPVFDFLFWTKERGDFLADDGPVIPVTIGIPTILEELCVKKNYQIPTPVTGYALIDTGASISAVHEQVLLDLGVQPLDSIPTHTPHGDGRSFVYPAKVSFPALSIHDYGMGRLMGCELKWRTKDGKEIIMLLGRDLLSQILFTYSGMASIITVSY